MSRLTQYTAYAQSCVPQSQGLNKTRLAAPCHEDELPFRVSTIFLPSLAAPQLRLDDSGLFIQRSTLVIFQHNTLS